MILAVPRAVPEPERATLCLSTPLDAREGNRDGRAVRKLARQYAFLSGCLPLPDFLVRARGMDL